MRFPLIVAAVILLGGCGGEEPEPFYPPPIVPTSANPAEPTGGTP